MRKLYVSYIDPYVQNCVRRVEMKTKMPPWAYGSGRRADGRYGGADSSDDEAYNWSHYGTEFELCWNEWASQANSYGHASNV